MPEVQQRAAASGVNDGIDVTITKILNDPVVDPATQVKTGQTVRVEGTWDASAADPQPGDQFTITFPDELKLGGKPTFDLVGEDNTIWGSCTVVPTTNLMTCALSGAVTDRPEDVHGTFYVFATAVKHTTSGTVNFEIKGQITPVPLPGAGGITDGYELPGKSSKSGAIDQNTWQSVRWTIDILGSDLAAMDPGNTGSVTLTDMLSENMKLCKPSSVVNAELKSGRKNLSNIDGVTITQEDGAGQPVLIKIENGKGGKAQPFDKSKRYEVQYTTCATDGVSEAEVAYSNQVTINGQTVGGTVDGKFVPETAPSKTGKWVDEAGRRSKIDWTIFVPGTVFFASEPDQTVTIADTLSASDGVGHKYCDATLEIYRVERLATPGLPKPKDEKVTGQFTIVGGPEADGSTFTAKITPNPKFDLAATKYYYEVRFQTCLTGSDIPLQSNEFINSATVNHLAKVRASVKGHDFQGGKGGRLSEVPQKVAGVEQPAGTTLNWNVQIPGQHLEGNAGPAVITDTFSETMTVCQVSGNLKDDLNLKVTAKDSYGDKDGKKADDRNLRDATGAELVKNPEGVVTGVKFTLPKEEGDYNRQTRYFIDYTLCTTSGGLDEYGTLYKNTVTYTGMKKALEGDSKQSWGGGGTGTGVSRGSFSLLKEIDRFGEEVPMDTEFTVRVQEFAPGKIPGVEKAALDYKVKVKAGGTPVSGQNARGNGWTILLSEIELPTVDGVYFEQGKFSPAEGVSLSADSTEALVAITPKSNVEVKLVNRASLGTAKITKTVIDETGGGLTGNEVFVFKADVDLGNGSGAERREFTLKHGQSYDLGKLPIGAKVTFAEVQPINTDRVTWAEPVVTPKTLTIGAGASANAVSVTNRASTTQGTFELKKKLTGPEAYNAAVPASFDVLAAWTDASGQQSKTLTLPKNGDSVPFGQNLPGGTKVTLKETVPANGNGLAWGLPAFSGNVTIGDGGAAVVTIGKEPGAVEVTNYVGPNDGTLRLLKSVTGEAAEKVGDDVEFTVQARWNAGTEYKKAELTVKNGVATDLGVKLPVGTEVTFTESGRPGVEGVEWGTISWGTNPGGESWLHNNADGTATGIVSDDPTVGRLITLSNEALWKLGSLEFTKHIIDGDDVKPAKDADLPAGAEFKVRLDGIDPALPEGAEFPAVGETITLNAGNGWSFKSGDVLPRNTVVTFSEVDSAPLPGIAWARPYYFVAKDAGDAEFRNTVKIVAGAEAVVQIRNRPIPTAELDISKIVTGPKGAQVTKDPSTTFQVTATWTDIDDEARSCVLDIKPGTSATPTAQCDASVIDGKVQFPLNTKISFVETGGHTDVTNVQWGEVLWSAKEGSADLVKIDSEPTGTSVTLTGEVNDPVVLGLENKSSSKGLIIIPIPIPLPPWGGPLIPGWPGSVGPNIPGANTPGTPGTPGAPDQPAGSGHNGAPGKPAPTKPDQSGGLPVTGANVIWLVGAALALIAGGAWLTLRNRRRTAGE